MRVHSLAPLLLLVIGLPGGSCPSLGPASVGAGRGESEGTCQERASRAQRDVETVRLAHLECDEPRDCTLFDPSTQCRGECPNAVAVAGLDAVEDAVARVDETVCRDYAADGCPLAVPGCAPVAARCEAGVCVSAPAS